MELEDVIVLVMRAGLAASVALILSGLLLLALGPDKSISELASLRSPINSSLYPPASLVINLPSHPAVALLFIGLAVLMATPLVRVALAVAEFIRERDAIYTALTLFVLFVLFISLILPRVYV